MCALVGMFILTLPVPIIVTSFASYYKNRLWRQQLSIKRNDEAIKQAERVKEILISNTGKTLTAGKLSFTSRGCVRNLKTGVHSFSGSMNMGEIH